VQRGTDRTAAELALPRLARELAEVEEQKQRAVAAVAAKVGAKRAKVRDTRLGLTLLLFIVLSTVGSTALGTALFALDGPALVDSVLFWPHVLVCIAVPVWFFSRYRLPPEDTSEVAATARSFDERLEPIRAQIRANRAILDQLP
jgi:hypothetical protein